MEETAASSKRARPPDHVWVRFKGGVEKVDTKDCRDVAELRKLVKNELGQLSSVSRELIHLCLFSEAEDGSTVLTPLRLNVTMEELVEDPRFQPNSFEQPLIVQVKPPSIEWKTSTKTTSPLQPYKPQLKYRKLHSDFLVGSGLPAPPEPDAMFVLYCREEFHKQFEFLQKTVLEQSRKGWILGPPGTGKSLTALSFLSTLDRTEWVITWIHLFHERRPMCMRFEGDTKKCQRVKYEDIEGVLYDVDKTQKHIVILDGYRQQQEHKTVQQACDTWFIKDRQNRRYAICCSMSARGKVDLDRTRLFNTADFFVCSWRLEEYKEAIADDDFYNNVKLWLEPAEETVIELEQRIESAEEEKEKERKRRIELVESKYYFAGGSARFMFFYSRDEVVQLLDEALRAAGDIMPYITSTIGDFSHNVVNWLFSSFRTKDNTSRYTSIVSKWAALECARTGGTDWMKKLAKALEVRGNPTMNGWMFEMWFFACIRNRIVEVHERGIVDKWHPSPVRLLHTIPSLSSFPTEGGVWLKPYKWNLGGYDAVYIDKGNQLVRFVQVTTAQKHAFKIEFFCKFLVALRDSQHSFENFTLDIVFLIPKGLSGFQIDPVIGDPRQLNLFKGWEHINQRNVLDKLKILTIESWDTK